MNEWNGWEACGVRFQARSELALIPNMMYMDYDVYGCWMNGGKGKKPTAQEDGAQPGARLMGLGARLEGL